MTLRATSPSPRKIEDDLACLKSELKVRRSARSLFESIEVQLKSLSADFVFSVEVLSGSHSFSHEERAIVQRTTQSFLHVHIPPQQFQVGERSRAKRDILTISLNDAGLIVTNATADRTWTRVSSAADIERAVSDRFLESGHLCQSPLGSRQPDPEPTYQEVERGEPALAH